MKAATTRPQELEGTWELRVTLRSCQTGAPEKTFRAISIFNNAGTLTETSANDVPPVGGVGQGFWRHVGGPNYTAVMKLFCFNPDGSFAGIERVTRNIELSDDCDGFSATASVEVFDPADKLVRTGCATVAASRLQ
jgi:hypothetical protein